MHANKIGIFASCVLNASAVEWRSIPAIDTRLTYRSSVVNTRSTCRLTLGRHVSRKSVDSRWIECYFSQTLHRVSIDTSGDHALCRRIDRYLMVDCRQHVGRLSMIYRCSKSFSVSVVSLLKRQLSCLIRLQLASARSSELFRRFPARAKVALNRVVQGYSRRLIWGGKSSWFVKRVHFSCDLWIDGLTFGPVSRNSWNFLGLFRVP